MVYRKYRLIKIKDEHNKAHVPGGALISVNKTIKSLHLPDARRLMKIYGYEYIYIL